MVEPNPEEVQTFTDVGSVADWVGIPGPQASSVRASLFALFGLQGATHFRVLAAIPKEDFDRQLSEWRVLSASTEGGQSGAPSLAQLAQAGLWGRAARIAGGTQRRIQEVNENADLLLRQSGVSSAPDASVSPQSVRKVKLTHVIDQSSDVEADTLTQQAIDSAYARYDQLLGGEPPPDHEPSYDQLAGLFHTVNVMKLPPYVDFAVFGPHAIRTIRKLKLTGLVMNPSGQLTRIELVGPMNFDQWEACFNVFRTACVMLGLASYAALDAYKDHIKSYACTYSSETWTLLYQADTRARREQAQRIRRNSSKFSASPEGSERKVVDSDGITFDPSMPWEYVFRKLPKDFSFWKKEFESAAILITANINRPEASVTGEVPVASGSSNHITDPHSNSSGRGRGGNANGGAAPGNGGDPGKKRKRVRSRVPPGERVYETDDLGRNTRNRQGKEICFGFQDGSCNTLPCPRNPKFVHQCQICLSNAHGANQCSKNGKGKGKGKGKGGKDKYHG